MPEPGVSGRPVRPWWSAGARRLGVAAALGVLGVGILYVATILGWLVVVATPREPIGDPWLAVMESLTVLSALAFLGMAAAVACFADEERRVWGLATLATATVAAGLTLAVHFVQLTAVRQLWRAGELADYRLVWPSAIFALEYLAWDLMVGLTLILAGRVLETAPRGGAARLALTAAGALCLMGLLGPATGRMGLQNVAVLGYAVGLPVAAGLLARLFHETGGR